MSEHAPGLDVLGLMALVAFVLPVIFLFIVRAIERHHREPFGSLARAFLWGAIAAPILTIVVQLLVFEPLLSPVLAPLVGEAVLGAVIFAPFIEEFSKGLGLRFVRDHHPEPEDGLIYGAMAGFGFSATENVLYVLVDAFETGIESAVGVLGFRGIFASFGHASYTALIGWGLWKLRYGKAGPRFLLLGYVGAVALHALNNLAAVQGSVASALFLLALDLTVFVLVVRKVASLDRKIAPQG